MVVQKLLKSINVWQSYSQVIIYSHVLRPHRVALSYGCECAYSNVDSHTFTAAAAAADDDDDDDDAILLLFH